MRKPKQGTIISFRQSEPVYHAEKEREQNIIGLRIAEARHKAGMSLKAFSEHLKAFGVNVTAGAINKWEIGNCSPNAYQLIALCAALDITDPLNYFTGDYVPVLNDIGMKKVADYRNDLIATGLYKPESKAGAATEYVDMPVSDLRVSAGTGAFLDEGRFETVRFAKQDVPEKARFGVRVSGDSMEPVYHDGQIVWVEPCDYLELNEVGIFVYDGEGYIKVYGEQDPPENLAEHFTDSYGIRHLQPVLISFNPAYAPKSVLPNVGFEIIGKVL